jgi:hypothetical protein
MPSISNLTWAAKAGDAVRGLVSKEGQTVLRHAVEEILDAVQARGLNFGKTQALNAHVQGASISLFNHNVLRLELSTGGSAITKPLAAEATRIGTTLKDRGWVSYELENTKNGVLAAAGSKWIRVKQWGGAGGEQTISSLDGRALQGAQAFPTKVGPLPSPHEIRVAPAYRHYSTGPLDAESGATILNYNRPTSFRLTDALTGKKAGPHAVLHDVTSIRIPHFPTSGRLPVLIIEKDGLPVIHTLEEALKRATSL